MQRPPARPRRRRPWWRLPWWLFALALALWRPAAATAAPPGAAPAPMSEDAVPSPISPQHGCERQPASARFRITLEREAQLTDLVRWMSSVTCERFIWGASVRDGKVTVIAPEAVTMQQAYAAFHAALETMGLTVEETGGYLKVVESKDAVHRVLPVYGPGEDAPARDQFVTQLYRPRHEGRVDDVVAVIEHLKGERGTVQAVSELVIVTDTGSNVARMMEVIEEVDRPDASEADAIILHPLRHAEPEELATLVREVFARPPAASGGKGAGKAASGSAGATRGAAKDAGAAAGEPAARPAATSTVAGGSGAAAYVTAVAVDVRTRTLVVTVPREHWPAVRQLLERLDVEIPDDAGTLFVLPLRHADPEEVAAVLGSLPVRGGEAKAASGGAKPAAAGSGKGGAASASGGVSIGGEIQITADPATRSLVVMASYRDFVALRRVVEALDRERRQVYIEAYILELSTRHELGTDVSAHYGRMNSDGSLSLVSSALGSTSSAMLDTSVLTGLAAGVLGPQVAGSGSLLGLGQDIPAFGVVLQALEEHEDVNIVSDPHMYTADNKPARMEIGKTIPVPNGQSTIGATSITNVTYNRQDVTLSLEVTPHIGDGGALALDILIEDEQVLDGETQEGGPTTTKRVLELEEVVARDGQPVVLGGLVQEKETIGRRQIPGLGSIPVLGWLFKKRHRQREKVNLLVVLVPHVLESPEDARRIHERRLEERREFLERETAFEHRDLDLHVDYRKKAGLLAAVQSEARHMDEELRLHEQARVAIEQDVGRRIAPEGSLQLGERAREEAGP